MTIDKEIQQFVFNFRRPICLLLGLPEKKCSDYDLVIFVDYLIGYSKSQHVDKEQNLSGSFLHQLKALSPELRSELVLKKITEYFDRSNIIEGAFKPGFDRQILFSSQFKDHLHEWRKLELRKSFRKLHDSVNRMNRSVVGMISLLESKTASAVELQKAAREIRSSIQSCEHHLKSGIALSVVYNVHPQNIWRASHRLYVSRADRLTSLFDRMDSVLATRGVGSNLSGMMLKRQHRWKEGWRVIFENHRNFRKDHYAEAEQRNTF